MNDASQRARWAIFCKTGYDVRQAEVSKDKASEILQATDSEGVQIVATIPGAVQKRKKAPGQDWAALYAKAHAAGIAAGQACEPVPMVVQQHANMADDASPVVKQWHVPSGVCGFAWVVVKPGTHSFARWCSKNQGAKKDYYGGITVKWVSEFGQSMEQKIAYAHAFAQVLHDAGVPARTRDRMD